MRGATGSCAIGVLLVLAGLTGRAEAFYWPWSQGRSCPTDLATRTVAIVDPYSSGRVLYDRARLLGWEVIPVFSSAELPAGQPRVRSLTPVFHRGDAARTAEELLRLAPNLDGILPGSEWGVTLRGELWRALRRRGIFLNGNREERWEGFRDKDVLRRILEDAKLPVPKQMLVRSPEEAALIARSWGGYPIVVKPVQDAGTVGVTFCGSAEEVAAAVRRILTGRPNGLGIVERDVLLQEYVTGPEYAVNGVRVRGKTIYTGIWSYEKDDVPGAANIYRVDRLLPFEGALPRDLVRRTEEVLNAFRYDSGIFHIEHKGRFTLDAGFRGAGGRLLRQELNATDRDPFELALWTYTDPGRIHALPSGYRRRMPAAEVFIRSPGGGVRASHRMRGELERLQRKGWLEGFDFFVDDGEDAPQSRDLDTMLAYINVVAPDEATLEARIEYFKEWEEKRYFLQ